MSGDGRDLEFLREAIGLSREARAAGDHPFGALLVVDDVVVLKARNGSGDVPAGTKVTVLAMAS